MLRPRGAKTTRRSELFERQRPPRLVLRFALVLSAAIAVASAVILIVVYHYAASEAERAASRQASLVASTLLQRDVRSTDFRAPLSTSRRRELDRAFSQLLSIEGMVAVSLVRADGLVTYSSDPRARRAPIAPALVSDAASGAIVTQANRAWPGTGKVLETYAPARPGRAGGAALIVQSYDGIHDAARHLQLRVAAVLEVLLLVLFLVFVPLLARVTRRIAAQMERIQFQAFFDQLTLLPNRAHLVERLGTALQRARIDGRQLAALHVDLDRFREVNNTLGQEAGNAVLVEMAARIGNVLGQDAMTARLGGDEFAVVVECEGEKNAKALAERIRSAVEPPARVDGLTVAVNATVGIALFPRDAREAETLLKHAEVATYTAKEWHVGLLVYSPAVDAHDADQLELVGGLQAAAQSGQLRLHYQPRVDLATGAVVGYEALTYWEHPARGTLPPGAFIPLAERTGAIRHVTQNVLAGAVRQLHDWSSDEELTISVNLTVTDLLDPRLPRQLRALLRKHGVAPGRLCLELTERTVIAVPERARKVLDSLVAMGVEVAIDDFGTGHSSLAHLKSLPVHELKIDRSFVADMAISQHDRLIVLASIQLGHSLGLRVVAEGVETSDVSDLLRELGCDQAQGYLYGRPRPVEELPCAPQATARTAA